MPSVTPASAGLPPSPATAAIRRALRDGLNAHALDLVRDATATGRPTPELAYLAALACARMHALNEAEAWLRQVEPDRLDDRALATEAFSLAGRIAKDRFAALRVRDPARARAQADVAIEHYRRAFALGGAPYPAVNAATIAYVTGQPAPARALAGEALAACAHEHEESHWLHATRGEALLLLERHDEARIAYDRARALAGHAFGDLATMRRQLRLIGSAEALRLLDVVAAPAVIAFSGHMIDAADRRDARFPASLEGAVADALRRRVASYPAAIGFCQAACGADLLFLEAMQDAGNPTHIVLPCAIPDFVATSVAFAGEAWIGRFERAMQRATSVVLATEEPLLGDTVLFVHASNLIRGMASLHASELETEPLLLNASEPDALAHEGGTAATTQAWRASGHRVDTIDLSALRGPIATPAEAARAPAAGTVQRDAARRSLKSLVFADIKGFSQMPEQYTPRFAEVFLGTCKRLLDSLERAATDANTRGDGIYLVFERPGDAAAFAVRLQQALAGVDWTSLGLPAETSARVGLHTGPVFQTFDPVMGKPTFYGTHVNRAARLEPVVQPGHIFATEAFAASLMASGEARYACHYIGAMPLAKQFGIARLYRLVERDSA